MVTNEVTELTEDQKLPEAAEETVVSEENTEIAEEVQAVQEKPEITEPPKKKVSNRSSGIDIIKIFAAMMVVTVHFYLNTAFYAVIPITDTNFLPPIVLLWIAYTCVPLFMISTGYLMKNKTLSKDYYKGIGKTALFYIVVSTICLIYKIKKGYEYTPWDLLKGYLRFSHCDYAWYVEQYFVMFLCIPFINLAFNGLKSKKQHILLLGTVILLFSVGPSFYLGFDPNNQIKLLPEFPTKMYPLAYYYLGCFIRQYPPKKKALTKLIAFCLFVSATAFLTGSLYTQSLNNENHYFRSYHFFEYYSYPVFASAAGIFILLHDIKFKNKILVKVLSIIAQTSLLTYLMSRIFDLEYYDAFNNKYAFPDFLLRFRHIYEIVPKVYFLSLLCSLLILAVYTVITKIISYFLTTKETQ